MNSDETKANSLTTGNNRGGHMEKAVYFYCVLHNKSTVPHWEENILLLITKGLFIGKPTGPKIQKIKFEISFWMQNTLTPLGGDIV